MRRVPRRNVLTSLAALPFAPSALASSGLLAGEKPGKTKNTKFAANLEMWWSDRPYEERFKAAAEFGYTAAELWDFRSKDADKILKASEQYGVEITQFTAWGFTPGLNETKNHDAFLRQLEDACKLAKRWHVKKACVVAGNDVKGMTQEEMHANVIVALKRAAPIAEANDLTLVLEPMNIRVDHKGHCLYGSEKPLKIVREVKSSHVKILWDLYHMQISEGDLCGHLREGIDQIGYVQLADVPGRNEPTTGEVNWTRVLQELKALGYTSHVGLECVPKENEALAAKRIFEVDNW